MNWTGIRCCSKAGLAPVCALQAMSLKVMDNDNVTRIALPAVLRGNRSHGLFQCPLSFDSEVIKAKVSNKTTYHSTLEFHKLSSWSHDLPQSWKVQSQLLRWFGNISVLTP